MPAELISKNLVSISRNVEAKGEVTQTLTYQIHVKEGKNENGARIALDCITGKSSGGAGSSGSLYFKSASVSYENAGKNSDGDVVAIFQGTLNQGTQATQEEQTNNGGTPPEAGEPGGGAGQGKTTTTHVSRMVPFPIFNSCGDPMGPLEQEKFLTKITITDNVPVDMGNPAATINDASESIGAIDNDIAGELGLNLGEGEQMRCDQYDLGQVQFNARGAMRPRTRSYTRGSFNPIEVENVSFAECKYPGQRSPVMLTHPETGAQVESVMPISLNPKTLKFDVFPVKGEGGGGGGGGGGANEPLPDFSQLPGQQ